MDDFSQTGQNALESMYAMRIKRMAIVLKERSTPWAEVDDLCQWGAIGMLEAKRCYNERFGVPFEAFALKRIRGAMLDGAQNGKKSVSFEATEVEEAINTQAILDGTLPEDPMQILMQGEVLSKLAIALKELDAEDYQILSLHFFNEVNNREIAKILGVSEGYATKKRQLALENLGRHLRLKIEGEIAA